MIKTPFKKKSLTATKNGLFFDGSDDSVEVLTDSRYAFGSGDWSMSMIASVQNVGNDPIFLEMYNASTNALLRCISISGVLQFNLFTDQGTNVIVTQGAAHNHPQLFRFTFIRRGTSVELWINGKFLASATIPSTDTINFNDAGGHYRVGSRYGGPGTNQFQGIVCGLMFVSSALPDEQLQYIHLNNFVPDSLHASIIAHYCFNQSYGDTAFDSVEEYNYAKVTPIAAINGLLLDYDSDQIGSANLLTQSAWRNIYKKNVIGEYFLKFDNAGRYANIPTLTAYTSGSSWILAFVITKPRDISGFKALFSNQMTAHDNSNAIIIALYNFGPYTYMAGGVNNPSVTDNVEYCDKPFVVIVYSNPTESAIIWQGTKYAASAFTPPSGWEYFVFGRDRDVHFGDPGLSKAVFIDHAFTAGDLRLLQNMHQSDDYKRIAGIKFDIDFAKLFTTGGDWFATDESGLSHHAKLFGFAIDDTEVIKMERDTFLPTRNALRFTAANSNYLKVSAFAPTDEAGYTYIVGFCLPSNRVFANEYFLAKRKPDNSNAKLLYTGTSKVIGFLNYKPPISDGGICNNDFTNYDTSKPLFFVGKEYDMNSKGLPFGFFEADVAKNPFGWDDVDGTALFIGSDDQIYGGSGFLDGYIFHVSIYKGILSKKQIFDIVNNGLGANPLRIPGGCELYLNFENLSPGRVIFDVDGPTSGHVVASGAPIVTYGTDADGDYCEFEYSGYAPAEVIYFYDPAYVIRTVDARFLLRVKVVSATLFNIAGFAYDTHSIPVNGNVIQDMVFIENPSFGYFTFQYQNAFSIAGQSIRIYKMHAQEIPTLKDYSPQNRIVQLYNFTDADLTEGDPDYKLFTVDSLR